MTRDEFNLLYTKLETEYKDFKGNYDEWLDVVGEYSYKDILNKIQKSNKTPIHINIIKGLNKEERVEDWITECDLCKKKFLIKNNDLQELEQHRRKCSKIDFIDLMSRKLKGTGITYSKYYNMTDEELEKAYRPVMQYYEQQPKAVLKKL